MGDPNLLQLDAMAAHRVQNQIQIAPRINHSRLTTLVVPHERTVLLEGRDGNGLVLQHVFDYPKSQGQGIPLN
jgi:hypothetical protein